MLVGYFKPPYIMSVSNEWVEVQRGDEVGIIVSSLWCAFMYRHTTTLPPNGLMFMFIHTLLGKIFLPSYKCVYFGVCFQAINGILLTCFYCNKSRSSRTETSVLFYQNKIRFICLYYNCYLFEQKAK